MNLLKIIAVAVFSLFCANLFAQNNISAVLLDESNGEALGFATVSLTKDGQTKPTKYVLSSEKGNVSFEAVRNGTYTVKAELLGYVAVSKVVKIDGKSVNLGEIKMKVDAEQLEAASVSGLGQQVVIKKDTIEYNAASFKTTESDVLEDLLKKLPGIEVGEDGSITSNGETISKITIDGKTFFLNDPQLASKNIPAKLIQKLKVIRKKSEQAEFSGIDDGNEETVIDLSVQPGMMKGVFGTAQGGVGRDIPADNAVDPEMRYQGNLFAGRFTTDSQISLVLNGNNTNGSGATNFSGNMMSGMRGGGGMGGGRGGITTSYMGGLNAAYNLFDDRMEVGGNYVYNGSNNISEDSSERTTFLNDYNLIYNTNSANTNNSDGHRFGIRLEHKFSENTSIIFEPQINFGTGDYTQASTSTTYNDNLNNSVNKVNDAYTKNTGENKNVSAGGYFLFRQRLGLPGRTLTANINVNFSNNDLDGLNDNGTIVYGADGSTISTTNVLQSFTNNQQNSSFSGRLTYTEPLGDGFYVEANYSYNWNKSSSDKLTYDLNNNGAIDYNYSNSIINLNRRQEIGANALYQAEKARFQLGLSAMPNYTFNSTTKFNMTTQQYSPTTYEDFRWNFSPQAMVTVDPSDNVNMRIFYRGNSSQPSTSQLMPVPDNTDPLNIGFGNPSLTPYFTHNINSNLRYSNRQRFSSFNISLDGGFTQNPIVNTVWYSAAGGQYSMPFNGPTRGNASLNFTTNLPIGRSNFTVSNTTRASYNLSSSYVGTNIDMSSYDSDGYYAFMNEFIDNFNDPTYYSSHITENTIQTVSANERLRVTYRGTALEATLGGSTRMNKSWYSISTQNANTMTWNNQISANLNWTWDLVGLTVRGDFDYNWYNGYSTDQPSQSILNATISKLLFNKTVTLSLSGSDLLGQSRNLTVTDNANYHNESVNNTLGRYVILAFQYRFGTMGRGQGGRGMRGGMRGGMGGGMARGMRM